MERVLVIEDDPSIREVLALALGRAGIAADVVGDGREALARLAGGRYDAVLLDLMLPGMDGLDVCRALRARDEEIPVVMVTARADTAEVVAGLELGADDYVTKPFAPEELVARVRAVLRRRRPPGDGGTLRRGALEIDTAAHRARVDGREVALTATEFRLLTELARRPGQVFTRQLLLEQVWHTDYLGDSRLVDVAVQRLRAKLAAAGAGDAVETVRGVGYRLADR